MKWIFPSYPAPCHPKRNTINPCQLECHPPSWQFILCVKCDQNVRFHVLIAALITILQNCIIHFLIPLHIVSAWIYFASCYSLSQAMVTRLWNPYCTNSECSLPPQACCEEVRAFIDPLEELTRAEVKRIEEAEAARAVLVERLQTLKMQAASIQ